MRSEPLLRPEFLLPSAVEGIALQVLARGDGGLVIDLTRMRQVTIDPEARRARARIAGGCLLGSIDKATQKAGLVFPSGVVSHTGASGLILGGGTGCLTRRFGLSCDNVEGVSCFCGLSISRRFLEFFHRGCFL